MYRLLVFGADPTLDDAARSELIGAAMTREVCLCVCVCERLSSFRHSFFFLTYLSISISSLLF